MTGKDFVRYVEANLFAKDISKELFYKESGITTASMSQWRSGKHNPSQKAIDKAAAFFEKYENKKMYIAAQELPILDLSSLDLSSISDILPKQKEKATIDVVDDDLREYLDELRNRPEQRLLFSVTKNATKAQIEAIVKMIEEMQGNQ